MKLYRVTAKDELFYVYAIEPNQAEYFVYTEHFPEVLDDELADLFEIEEVTKAGIIVSIDSPKAFKKEWEKEV